MKNAVEDAGWRGLTANQRSPLPPIVDRVDSGIRDVVNRLRAAGFPTTSSCQGHDDAEWGRWGRSELPFVTLEAGSDPMEMALDLLDWLRKNDLDSCWVDIQWSLLNGDEGNSGPIVVVEWWSQSAVRNSSAKGAE